MQHTATHCNTLEHTATHCNTMQQEIPRGISLKHYNTLQHTATHCTTLQHTATRCNALKHIAKKPLQRYQPAWIGGAKPAGEDVPISICPLPLTIGLPFCFVLFCFVLFCLEMIPCAYVHVCVSVHERESVSLLMAHIWMHHATHVNASWHTYECVICVRHVARINVSCPIHECVVARECMNASCQTYECVVSLMRIRHVTRMNVWFHV